VAKDLTFPFSLVDFTVFTSLAGLLFGQLANATLLGIFSRLFGEFGISFENAGEAPKVNANDVAESSRIFLMLTIFDVIKIESFSL
jgi:hypothetical protein